MIACFDVHYEENTAYVAALVFSDWTDADATAQYTVHVKGVDEYIPGEFYKRELPGLLACFEKISEPLSYIVVDSFVWLGERKKGMGAHLYDALHQKIPVIGVGKTNFFSAENVSQVFRGQSEKPLYVSSVGIAHATAARFIQSMHGQYRNPTLLKAVDSLCRNFWKA